MPKGLYEFCSFFNIGLTTHTQPPPHPPPLLNNVIKNARLVQRGIHKSDELLRSEGGSRKKTVFLQLG